MNAAEESKNILVMRGGALGDFVLTLPVLAALRRRFPRARVEILGYPRVAALAQSAGLAERIHSIEAPALARMFAPDAPVNTWFAGFDLIVSYIFDPDGVWRANILRSAPQAVFLTGPHRPDESAPLHVTDALLAPLKAVGIHDADSRPFLNIPGGETKRGDLLAMHPGSGSEQKNWPEENWGALLALILGRTSSSCLLVGGEAERERLMRLRKVVAGRLKFDAERLVLAQDLPLVELGRRLGGCGAFVGHDSGVTHLAAALGLPGLVLWGPSNERVWRPRSEQMKILRPTHGLSRLPVAEVFGNLAVAGMVCAR